MVQQNRIFGLDAVRAFAIVLVIVSHSRFLNIYFPELGKLSYLGYLGVELFFVLSGFLIGQILISVFEKEVSFSSLFNFWLKRWIRTLPNYYLFLALITFLSLFFIEKPTPPHPLFYLFFFQNFAWERPIFFRESWSLCVEEWFYLIFPVLLIVVKYMVGDLKKSIITAAVIVILISLITRVGLIEYSFGVIRMIVLCRLDSMMFGVLAAYLKFYHQDKFYKNSKNNFYIGSVLFTIAAVYTIFYIKNNYFDKLILFYIVSLSFALILPQADLWKQAKRNFFTHSIEKISLWSYSLYLCNISVEEVLIKLRDSYGLFGIKPAILLLIAYWSISVLIAASAYTLFERPILSRRDSIIKLVYRKS